ncbi:hypothetical protein [Chamaesiphon sp. OTE_20_metabat_361]|uniref:hypothetical protein n=1 Tax=Chamaesiphon sp. OTE_20_metabat_361 TaxID=2964689 RepID=UPI00286B7B01|nr:hypothetical protein [Chamaesiphon sp. OTE_20_metabat_361]
MLDLNSIAEFSRCHCIGICAFLVPANLGLANATILLTAFNRSPQLIANVARISIVPALILLLHVATWWSIGVVMLPTFILPTLAIICLATQAYVVSNPNRTRRLLQIISKFSSAKYRQFVAN